VKLLECGARLTARRAPPAARPGHALLAAIILTSAPCGAAADPPAPAYPQGAAAFQANCSVCHGPTGVGVAPLAPPLLAYPARYAATAEGRRQLALTVLYGMFGDITVGEKHYNFQMPEFGRLDDATLAAVLNFLLFDLGHAPAETAPVTVGEIAAERAHPLDGAAVRAHRESVLASGP